MAIHSFSRSIPKALTLASSFSRSFTTSNTAAAASRSALSSLSLLRRLAAAGIALRRVSAAAPLRGFATRATSSSLNDPNPNWSNRPPKETILLDGCDFEHWLIVMEKPEGDPTRDEIIESYIKTLAKVVGSEEEARMKIYSVSTRCYFAFGALVSEELSYKIKELPGVRWVLPDSYLDVKNKDYGGEPFINGQAVPYDPKYHEEWIRNNARANERNRRNDRPRNFDRSRNFERRRENMQNRDFQNRPPMPNQPMQNTGPNMGGPPNQTMQNPGPNMAGGPHNMSGPPPNNNVGGTPPGNFGGGQNYNAMPPNNMPPNNYMQSNYSGMPPPPNSMGGMPLPPPPPPPPNSMGGMPPPPPPPNSAGGEPPHPNMRGYPPNNMGGGPPNPAWSNNNMPNADYQSSYPPNRNFGPGGNPYGG